MSWFYISFATDEEFLGATVVEGGDAQDAFFEATLKGLNPGGEAAILEIPLAAQQEPDFHFMKNKLCSKEQILGSGGKPIRELNSEQREVFDTKATRISAEDNVCN